MNRLFIVKKPCVIERRYYDEGAIYVPSNHMSDIALKVLIGNEFLEEKFPVRDYEAELLKCLDDIEKLTDYIDAHVRAINVRLDDARKILKEK